KNVFARYGVEQSSLEEIASLCDYVTLHTPLNDETRGMIDKQFLSKMKPTAFLINTSRGPVVNQTDLYEALSENLIAGAGIDVFDEEPIAKDNPLLELDNIMLTPHVAYNTREANILSSEILIDNLTKALNKEYCEDIVN
ncbi:MAG: D-glycerate dehydrogenase, partial [Oscillospiraceae bacterium]|nr:D-glycerate dehydrogenase [Oscillospiraceae bacterium]